MSGLRVELAGETGLVLRRSFGAPRRLVFEALTRPELLVRWHGARGWNLTGCEVDLRVGGRYRFESGGPGGQAMVISGVYREVVPGERLVFTEWFDEQSYPGETVVTTELTEAGGRTDLTTTVVYATRAAREIVLAYPMERGAGESYDRLEELLKGQRMNWTLEVVVVPVSDVDRAKDFYENKCGFVVDHDTRVSDDMRIVQLTPPGSGCSIVISKGMVSMAPGSIEGLQLVVNDVHAARKELLERGADVGEVQVYAAEGPRPEQPGDDLNNAGFVFFSDPDGNKWAVQQITARP